jgi:hypothetical protein
MNLEAEMEAVDTLTKSNEAVLPDKSVPIADRKSTGNEEVDQAFREIARLKSAKPENRSEEISVQMKIRELRSVLSSLGHRADTETLDREGWTRPRPSSHP